ncbi:MAG: cysteine--tRNA ligase, partial [Anaerolineales bacterium]|nr:cysteine--tRNA ligase [Anaerolineales bacterium]
YNTLTRTKEPFEPIDPDNVRLYVCGVTVYDSSHIGHAMSALVFDMVRRYLGHRGYGVTHVLNFTDVDDKIIDRAHREGVPWQSITQRYIDGYLAEMDALNVMPATVYPHASQEIDEIIGMVERLIDEEIAYESAGDVYFRVLADEDYGKLSRRRVEDQQAGGGERVSSDEQARKQHPMDFALWKAAKPGEPQWESPWGMGRPGWHIECSAMSMKYLGPQIDIHGGGSDLIFPHHENEIAQSESFSGQTPFVRYWMHNGMVQVSNDQGEIEKMSKSLGNYFAVDSFLARYSGDVLRLFVLSTLYRRPTTFSEKVIDDARKGVERFLLALRPAKADASEADEALLELAASVDERFHSAMDDDFNTPVALAALHELARALNGARDRGVGGTEFDAAQTTLQSLLAVLGFALDRPATQGSDSAEAAPFIDLLVALRGQLRADKQWALADQLRDRLAELGVTLEDGAEGTTWTI